MLDLLFGIQVGGWKATVQMILWFAIIFSALRIWWELSK